MRGTIMERVNNGGEDAWPAALTLHESGSLATTRP